MADRGQHRQTTGGITDSVKSIVPDRGPTKTQALAVATLFPTGGILLSLSGLALAASVVGLGLLAPIFLLFSPVLVPAALLMALAVTGFLTSGALGLGGLSSLACFARAARDLVTKAPDDTAQAIPSKGYGATIGQKAKDTAQAIPSKAQEVAGKTDK
ncbi:oleosin-like protein [Carex littledalei]|uniref:Oleosin-like protein n=1 Tax=Carex littledalei TaxID=544730 RepID=A0A833RAK1_9POAL|nr:oleosin-like protein [Carex littledalei]